MLISSSLGKSYKPKTCTQEQLTLSLQEAFLDLCFHNQGGAPECASVFCRELLRKGEKNLGGKGRSREQGTCLYKCFLP